MTEAVSGRLAIAATPNPATRGRVQLRLALPGNAPARVDLLDLAGRRVASEVVSGSGPGLRSLEIRGGRGITPGLYFARITQDGRSRTARIMVVDWGEHRPLGGPHETGVPNQIIRLGVEQGAGGVRFGLLKC